MLCSMPAMSFPRISLAFNVPHCQQKHFGGQLSEKYHKDKYQIQLCENVTLVIAHDSFIQSKMFTFFTLEGCTNRAMGKYRIEHYYCLDKSMLDPKSCPNNQTCYQNHPHKHQQHQSSFMETPVTPIIIITESIDSIVITHFPASAAV